MSEQQFPDTVAAILALGKTHEERAAAMGLPPRTLYHHLAGHIPARTLAPYVLHQSVVEALRRDLARQGWPGYASE